MFCAIHAYLVGIGTEWDTKGSGQAEISKLQIAITVDKQVLGFQVTVKNAVAVAIANTFNSSSPHRIIVSNETPSNRRSSRRKSGEGLQVIFFFVNGLKTNRLLMLVARESMTYGDWQPLQDARSTMTYGIVCACDLKSVIQNAGWMGSCSLVNLIDDRSHGSLQ